MIDPLAVTEVYDWMRARHAELGPVAVQELEKWRGGKVPYAYPEILDQHLVQAHRELHDPRLGEKHLKLLFDAFYQILPFGTGGRRGSVGYGANRLNPSTIALTIQGHCDYLHRTFANRGKLTVVVANDVRIFKDIANIYGFLGQNHPLIGMSSRSFGKLACTIYAANGISAYFAEPGKDQAVLTTPELSFLIKQLQAVGGVNISASHNPPDDNGVKVYDEYGSQPIAPNDQTLVEAMRNVAVRELPFEQALREGLVRAIPGDLHQKYLAAYVEKYDHIFVPRADVPIVYTPLCGCGLTTAGEALTKIGFPWQIPPGQEPDGTFSSIPFKAPNPEVPEATTPAKAFADKIGAGIVLSSDPDADRVGLEAKLPDGTWYHFDGNQISTILCYFLMLDPQGPKRKGLVIETLVTTRLLGEITRRSPGSKIIDDLLVGFKYVADVLKSLEITGRYLRQNGEAIVFDPKDLVLATEESHGVIVLSTIRDKDATPACLYLAALYQRLHLEGKTLLDYYLQILNELGGYDSVMRSITMFGADGMAQISRIMKSLRANPPKELEGESVHPEVIDFWNEEKFGKFKSETDRLPRNVFQFSTDSCTITIRPSGTEPKIKLYCQIVPGRQPSSLRGMELFRSLRERAEGLTRSVYGDLLQRAGLPRLGHAALFLPDIISFERKQIFQDVTMVELHKGLKAGRWANLAEVLAWLREQAALMTPGADPLPALRRPLAYLCKEWSKEQPQISLLAQLEGWTKA